MKITIETSDPEAVTPEAVTAALSAAGFFVGSVAVNPREDHEEHPTWVRHTVPVWVAVRNGVVERAVVEDEALSEPLGAVTPEVVERGWVEEDVLPLSPAAKARFARIEADGRFPAWEFGF